MTIDAKEMAVKHEPLLIAEAFVAGAATIAESTAFDAHAQQLMMCRAVIAQDKELGQQINCPRCGRNDLQLRHLPQHLTSCLSRTDEEQRILDLEDENRRFQEFIAASKECADANAIITLTEENERIRAAVTDMIDKLNKGSVISAGTCSWCQEKWLHLDGKDVEEVRAAARLHAYRCVAHPMRIERDMLREQLEAARKAIKTMTPASSRGLVRALVDACDLHDAMVRKGWDTEALLREHLAAQDRILELRELANAVMDAHAQPSPGIQ